MILPYQGRTPKIGKRVYIAPTAVVIGDVTLGDDSNVWFNAVIRGDLAPIFIGQGTNIQDNCTLHTDTGIPLNIGECVTVGHNAVVHGCTIHPYVLIGMGAVILNHAVIGEGSIIAANALIKERHVIAPHSLAAGVPAEIKKSLASESNAVNDAFAKEYRELSANYRREDPSTPNG